LHDQLIIRIFIKNKEYGTIEEILEFNWESQERGVVQHQYRKSGLLGAY
jgi:hypothetical protein